MAITDTTKNITTYVGQVLGTEIRRNVRIMSDVWGDELYATIFDGAVRSIWKSWDEKIEVDATPGVIAAAAAWQTELARLETIAESFSRDVRNVEFNLSDSVKPAAPVKGDEAIVYKGRKVPVGTKGRVFWIGECTYGWRDGLELADGSKVFTAIENVTTEAALDKHKATVASRPALRKLLVTLIENRDAAYHAVNTHREGVKA